MDGYWTEYVAIDIAKCERRKVVRGREHILAVSVCFSQVALGGSSLHIYLLAYLFVCIDRCWIARMDVRPPGAI